MRWCPYADLLQAMAGLLLVRVVMDLASTLPIRGVDAIFTH